MISRIEIQNFQSHKQTELELHPGVNIIVGSTDSGKSAIFRALRWVFRNRPSGDEFRSDWGGSTEVKLLLSEGDIVSRIKDRQDEYRLNTLTFRAFRTDVPPEIQQALNIGDLNFQSQLDAPFLLKDSTPGEVAQHFNRVANLDMIDQATQTVNGWITGLNGDLRHLESEKDTSIEQLNSFRNLDQLDQSLEVLESMEQDILQKSKRIQKLTSILDQIRENERKTNKLLPWLGVEESLLLIIAKLKEKSVVNDNIQSMEELLDSIQSNNQEIARLNRWVELAPLVDGILEKLKERNSISQAQGKLYDRRSHITNILESINSKTSELTRLEKEFKQHMGSQCPLCGQKINKIV